MNIDGSSLLSLFSSTESLEGLQQTLQLEGTLPQEFDAVLMEKLAQLKDLQLDENFTLNLSDAENTLQGFADLLDENPAASSFSSFFGKNLPMAGKFKNEIDLEDTLQSLENVMNNLEGLVVEEDALKQELENEKGLTEVLGNLFSTSEDKDHELSETLSNLMAVKKEITEKQIKTDDHQAENIHEQDEELVIANQISAIVATMDEPIEAEVKSILAAGHTQEILKKSDSLVFKHGFDEKALAVSDNEDSDTFLQQENAFRKSSQDNPVIVAKENEKTGELDIVDVDINKSKSSVKFATDIANLNRAVLHDNKTEIPPMTKHFAHPEWNKEVGERVIWMHKQEIPSAELRLNPRHLGPVTIKVDVSQDQATISFIAQHAAVKEAIEAAIPKLREMFSAQQLNLADVNVTQDDSSQRQSKGFDQMGNGSGQGNKNTREEMNNDVNEHTMDITEEIEAGRALASNGVLSVFA